MTGEFPSGAHAPEPLVGRNMFVHVYILGDTFLNICTQTVREGGRERERKRKRERERERERQTDRHPCKFTFVCIYMRACIHIYMCTYIHTSFIGLMVQPIK